MQMIKHRAINFVSEWKLVMRPFNWSQQTDANNAYPIQGQNSFAGGYDVQIAKR